MKMVDSELYDLAIEFADQAARLGALWPTGPNPRALRYLELREASGDPLPYKIIRDGDKVRFE